MDKVIELLQKDIEMLEALQKELARIAEECRKPINITNESIMWTTWGDYLKRKRGLHHVKSDKSD